MIYELSPICISLQETMVGDTFHPCPKDYVSYRTEYDPVRGSHGGCAIFVRYDVTHSSYDLQTPLQAVAIQLHLKKRYTIVSLYLPPSITVAERDLIDLFQQLPSPFLVMGDFNGKHYMWGEETADPRGNMIAAFVGNEDVSVLNTGEPTHFHVQTGTFSRIDLSICSSNCYLDFAWQVLEDQHTSDHFPIIIDVEDSLPAPRSPRWCLERANWSQFKDHTGIDADVSDMPSIDDAINLIYFILLRAASLAIPRTTGKFHRRPVPWWNKDCYIAHKAMRAACTRYKRHRYALYLVAFKKARARFRRQLKKARRESWMAFLSTITWKTPLSQIWNKVRKIAGKFTPRSLPVLQVNDNQITDPKLVCNAFADHFAGVSHKNPYAPYFQYRENEEKCNLDFRAVKVESYNLPFSMKELVSALSKCKDTAPGADDIPYAMLKNASWEFKVFLLNVINRLWKESIYPSVWEMAIILPFLKPGKDSKLPSNYRPISLTSCISKLMEKMVNERLMWYLERNGYLSPSQFGFRRLRSCTDALLRLESKICEAFATKKHLVTVFFDLEKAYDRTWRFGILKALYNCELRGELPLFIRAFMLNRKFRVKVGTALSEIKDQEEGVPQGCVLSVTLFALAINGIASVIPSEIMHTLFVDDLSISFAASKMSTAERKIQLTIDRIVLWAERHGFKFSTSKTVVMHFCRVRLFHPDPDIFLKGHRISCVDQTRFLGLVFDRKLTWEPHLKMLKNKCLKALEILKILSHTSWGADRQHLLQLYKALILPKLLYGCEVYSSAQQSKLDILNSIHHAGIRCATGAFRSSPITSMLVDAGELPLNMYRHISMIRYWFRVQRLPNSLICKSIINGNFSIFSNVHPKLPKPFGCRIGVIMEEYGITQYKIQPNRYSPIPPWKLPCIDHCQTPINSKRDLEDIVVCTEFLKHMEEHRGSVFIFTDGSKSNAGVGFGAVSKDFNRYGALPKCASIFTAELHAILIALKQIVSLSERRFVIFSDSRSALQALEMYNSLHPLIMEILEWMILARRKGKEITFCWIPAHVGIVGNEKADELAKFAALKLAPKDIALPSGDYFPVIRAAVQSSWQFMWELEDRNKMREIASNIFPWKYYNMARRKETALCRLRIGHTRLTHGFLMSRDPPPFCEDCLVPQTVRHLLVECPSLTEARHHFLIDCKNAEGDYVLHNIIGKDFNEFSLFGFLIEIGVLEQL